jgi:hypothetical protein
MRADVESSVAQELHTKPISWSRVQKSSSDSQGGSLVSSAGYARRFLVAVYEPTRRCRFQLLFIRLADVELCLHGRHD